MLRLCTILALAVVGGACEENTKTNTCKGMVDDVMAGSMGMLEIAGDFSDGQPILQVSTGGGVMLYPAATYTDTTATFSGLPSGMHTVNWLLSCFDNGTQVTMSGPGMITVP